MGGSHTQFSFPSGAQSHHLQLRVLRAIQHWCRPIRHPIGGKQWCVCDSNNKTTLLDCCMATISIRQRAHIFFDYTNTGRPGTELESTHVEKERNLGSSRSNDRSHSLQHTLLIEFSVTEEAGDGKVVDEGYAFIIRS